MERPGFFHRGLLDDGRDIRRDGLQAEFRQVP